MTEIWNNEREIRSTIQLFLCLLISSCLFGQTVTPDHTARIKGVQQAEAACGDPTTNFDVSRGTYTGTLAPLADHQARIVIFELWGPGLQPLATASGKTLRGATMRIGMDGNWAGAIKGRSFLALTVNAGEHHLCVRRQSRIGSWSKMVLLTGLHAKPGHRYYWAILFSMFSVKLTPVNPDEAKLLLAATVPAVATIRPIVPTNP